jgi:predicted cytidylate kinase
LITISGTPGSGKTTVARLLAKRLGLPHVYAGDLFRKEAEARHMRLADFNALAERDHSIDRELDRKMAEQARAGNRVLEGRLAAFIARQEGVKAFKVWLNASDAVRAQRAANRDGGDWEAVLEANRVRQRSDAKRYRDIYGFDLEDTSIYDLVLATDTTTPEELADQILESVRAWAGDATVPS